MKKFHNSNKLISNHLATLSDVKIDLFCTIIRFSMVMKHKFKTFNKAFELGKNIRPWMISEEKPTRIVKTVNLLDSYRNVLWYLHNVAIDGI